MTTQITADTAYITYDQFNPTHLGGESPKGDSFKDETGQTISFSNMALNYNYGTSEAPIVTDFYIELPPVKARGIRTKEEEKKKRDGGTYTKVSHAQMIIFELSDPENVKCIEALNGVHAKCSQLLGETAWAKKNDYVADRPGGMFKNPVYWPRDSVTQEIQEGKNPNMWIKLKGGYQKPLFTTIDANGNSETIDWALLRNVDITYIPLLHIERTFIGNKATLQVYLQSAIVLDIKEANTTSRQVSTIDRLREKYGSKFQQQQDNVQASLAKLRMDRQDQILAESVEETLQPTSEAPSSKTKTETETMTEFLSAAPTMQQPTQVSLPVSAVPIPAPITSQPLQPTLNVQSSTTPTPSLNVQPVQRVVLS